MSVLQSSVVEVSPAAQIAMSMGEVWVPRILFSVPSPHAGAFLVYRDPAEWVASVLSPSLCVPPLTSLLIPYALS